MFPEDLGEYDRQPDPFFQAVTTSDGQSQYALKLPEEYNEWLAMQPLTSKSGQVRIVSPRNGDLFLLDAPGSASGTTAQRLEFKLTAPTTQPVEWRLNGQTIASQTSHSVFWTPKPGNWTLQVKSGGRSDQVKFQVQIAETGQTRRGFSFAR